MNSYGFLALAMRQRLIKRWPLMHSSQPESVLEHSAVVGLLSMLVAQFAIGLGKQIDLGMMLSHALIHDAPEILTGDVITPVKHANPRILAEMREIEAGAEQQLLQTVPAEMQQFLAVAFGPGGYEQQLVKACDTYAAFIKCKLEVAAGNSMEFGDALSRMVLSVNSLISQYPEMAMLHETFGDAVGLSVDALLNTSAA